MSVWRRAQLQGNDTHRNAFGMLTIFEPPPKHVEERFREDHQYSAKLLPSWTPYTMQFLHEACPCRHEFERLSVLNERPQGSSVWCARNRLQQHGEPDRCNV